MKLKPVIDGCEWCKYKYKPETLYDYHDWDGGVSYDYVIVNYCPICGRKLTDRPSTKEDDNKSNLAVVKKEMKCPECQSTMEYEIGPFNNSSIYKAVCCTRCGYTDTRYIYEKIN